jgi:hypothetical protein
MDNASRFILFETTEVDEVDVWVGMIKVLMLLYKNTYNLKEEYHLRLNNTRDIKRLRTDKIISQLFVFYSSFLHNWLEI